VSPKEPVEKVRPATAGPFTRSIRFEILDESIDSPPAARLDLEQNDAALLSEHVFNRLLGMIRPFFRIFFQDVFNFGLVGLVRPFFLQDFLKKGNAFFAH